MPDANIDPKVDWFTNNKVDVHAKCWLSIQGNTNGRANINIGFVVV